MERRSRTESNTGTDTERRPKFDPKQDKERRDKYRALVERSIYDFWRRGRDRDQKFKKTPWLLVRYAPGDVGLRPVPSGTNFWSSPDIWVESSDPAGNPVAGENNYIWARIFDLGNWKAAPVKVDYFWANPALGLGPANWINGYVGTEYCEVRSQFSIEVRCRKPWVPQFLNSGHECLLVQCNNGFLDPIEVPFGPTLDRHVAQRNVSVIRGRSGASLAFDLEINNFLAFAIKTQVLVRAIHVARMEGIEDLPRLNLVTRLAEIGAWVPTPSEMARMLRAGTRAHADTSAARNWVKEPLDTWAGFRRINSSLSISAEVSEKRRTMFTDNNAQVSAELLLARNLMRGSSCGSANGRQIVHGLTMDSMETRNMHAEIDLPVSAKQGEFLVVHFEQVADEISLGGYTLVVEVTA